MVERVLLCSEKKLEYMRKYREKHRELLGEKQRKYAETHREQLREYRRKYRNAHKKHLREKECEYVKNHLEHVKEYQRKYRQNPEHRKKHILCHREYKGRLKREVFSHYSPNATCQRCGFSDIRALTLDHINGNGLAHRKSIGKLGGHEFYQWIKANGFPNGYQVLCMNCQLIKRFENFEWSWERAMI